MLKKARVWVLLFALLPVTTPLHAQEQVIAWNPVGTWSGSSDAATEPFAVQGAVWRLRWELDAIPGFTPRLLVWVHPSDGPRSITPVLSHNRVGDGVIDLGNGPGRFFLEVVGVNGDWTLSVEELAQTRVVADRTPTPIDTAPTLAQQTPAVDISGGYSFLRDQEIETNFHGWVASMAGNVNEWFGIVGEVGGNYRTLQAFDTDIDLSVHSFLAGPRFSGRGAQVTSFGQVLLGVARASAGVLGETASVTEFALQPGGGVDVWLRPNVGIRVGGDYRRIFAEGAGTNEFRFHVGIVVAAGIR